MRLGAQVDRIAARIDHDRGLAGRDVKRRQRLGWQGAETYKAEDQRPQAPADSRPGLH
jgi:hypothetical protein